MNWAIGESHYLFTNKASELMKDRLSQASSFPLLLVDFEARTSFFFLSKYEIHVLTIQMSL